LLRPVRLSDEDHLRDLLYRLSDESTYKRFFSYKRYHPHDELQKLVDLDYAENMALVGEIPGEEAQIIGISRYDVDPATKLGDIAFVVRDEWQGKGVGTVLMRRMTEIARARGLAGFSADVLADNHTMLDIFHRSGLYVFTRREGSTYSLTATFDANDPCVKGRR
jgi:GNAT superfamily N-acetyltransferase